MNDSRQIHDITHARRAADAALAALAASQHGVVSSGQLRDVGIDRYAVRHRIRRHQLHVIVPRVYSVGHTALSRESRWMAAVLAAGPGAVLSHQSAAQLHQIWKRRWNHIDVIARHRVRSLENTNARVRRLDLDPQDRTSLNGIPVTTIPRLLIDLARVIEAPVLAQVIHEAAYRDLFHERAVRQATDRAGSFPRRHVLELALEMRRYGSAGSRSDLEDIALAHIVRARLNMPLVNVNVQTDDAIHEVDLFWPELRLCVEIDGPGHLRPRTQQHDRVRDAALRHAGYRVLRFGKDDVIRHPNDVVAIIRHALRTRQ